MSATEATVVEEEEISVEMEYWYRVVGSGLQSQHMG